MSRPSMVRARDVGEGLCLQAADGRLSAPIDHVDWVVDEDGEPTHVVVRYADGDVERMPADRELTVVDPAHDPGAVGSWVPPTPDGLLGDIATAFPDDATVQRIARRLGTGFDRAAPEQIEQVATLGYWLFARYDAHAPALSLCSWVAAIPFEGDWDLWTPLEPVLALGSYLAHLLGDPPRAAAYAHAVRSPDRAAGAERVAVVRQRGWDQPDLYEGRIAQAILADDAEALTTWRLLALQRAMTVLVHGGSATLSLAELNRTVDSLRAALRDGRLG
jgi:hypothetical protein